MDDDQTQDDQNSNALQDDLNLVDPDDAKHQASKPPSVIGEEDAFSGDMPAESPDIDEELAKVGLSGDDPNSTPDALGVNREIDEDEKAI